MALTVLNDVIVPDTVIAAGVRGKQMRRNDRARGAGGVMKVSVGWSKTLRQYELGIVPMTIDQWQALEAMYEVTDAGAYGMLMPDPKDHSADDDTGRVTLISAGAHTYQLIKRTTSLGSTRTKDRIITRPKAAGFVVKVSGAPLGGGSYTLDADTGIITIPSDPAVGDVTWASDYYVPVHFRDDEIDWEMVRPGSDDERLFVGPSVVLDEVRE